MIFTIDLITMTGNFDTHKESFNLLNQVRMCEEQIVLMQLQELWDCLQWDLATYRPFEKAWNAWATRYIEFYILKDHDNP